jgi:arsenate reductase-like glutaredoxin family protein
MSVRFLRCSREWVKVAGHPCWRVQKALDDMGIEYEVVTGPPNPWERDKRTELIEKTGGNKFPAIVFEDGSAYREESKDMAKTIRAGKLFEQAGTSAPAATE